MQPKKILFVICMLFSFKAPSYAGKITRAVVACDTNPKYLPFWPLVAKAWKEIVGIPATLILIGDDDIPIDTTCGDVIRFKPIPGLSTACQAQCIRLLAGYYFPNETYIISDMDMIPCTRNYFLDAAKNIPDDYFIVYKGKHDGTYPMCYLATKGIIAMEIFNCFSLEDVRNTLTNWIKVGWGWNTDQILLTQIITDWHQKTGRVAFLNHGLGPRVDRLSYEQRGRYEYNKSQLRNGGYIDAHLLRPFDQYFIENMEVIYDLGLEYSYEMSYPYK